MGESLKGKKLLVLGGKPVGSQDVVRKAQELGIYVIVTDNLEPKYSPAKLIADEVWNISTADVNALAERCKTEKVDGAFTGVHEFNLKRLREVCQRCNYYFYATDEQLKLNFDKLFFKDKCRQFGIKVPKNYGVSNPVLKEELKVIEYPVIVKPRDGSGGLGITICHTQEKLLAALPSAYSNSETGSVIVEEYVVGREITAVYTIVDGQIELSCFRDRYPTLDGNDVTSQYDLSLIPSAYTKWFIEHQNQKFVDLFRSVNAKNAVVFFQGIANEQGITFFECGYRMNGLCDYHNVKQLYGYDYLEMMIRYAVEGNMGGTTIPSHAEVPSSFSAIFNMTAHAGVIGKLSGLEEVLKLDNVIAADFLKAEGDTIIDTASMAQSVFRANIWAKDKDGLANVIKKIQKNIIVEDEDGNNMLFVPFDVERLWER